ncbi:MAG: DegT/DnrJ/EryC1/StrS family aminotransferase [Flavobacterium sp.]|nr:DegT/DnrJ/EryC1/StrS family aminotransferase [Candidatus Neoflavobacterium equi]
MKDDKIWLSSPHMGGKEIHFINDAFENNWIAPLGPNVNGFENDIQHYLKTTNGVAALSSGTAALHLALILAGVSAGDLVICQTLTFAASANPITYLNAKPVFVDSEDLTYNMSPDFLKLAIEGCLATGKKPKAIIAVHLYGMPYQKEAIEEIAAFYDIPVIEDSAEALGSSYKGQKCGTFGSFGILSFNGNKIITTSGGGALVANKERTDKAVFLATQARDNAPHYQHSQIGYNYRMSNICAGIGRGQMEVLDNHVEKRRAVNSFYRSLLQDVEEVIFQSEPDATYFSNFWLTSIRILPNAKGYTTTDLRLALDAAGIESRPVWKPMHLQPVFTDCAFYGTDVAENLFNYGLCLPSGSNLSQEDLNRISDVLSQFFELN